jgi:hypothetical protein
VVDQAIIERFGLVQPPEPQTYDRDSIRGCHWYDGKPRISDDVWNADTLRYEILYYADPCESLGSSIDLAGPATASLNRFRDPEVFDYCDIAWPTSFGSAQVGVVQWSKRSSPEDTCALAKERATALYPRFPR